MTAGSRAMGMKIDASVPSHIGGACHGKVAQSTAFCRSSRFARRNTLRFAVGGAADLHVALQGGTAPTPLRLDRPLVLCSLQLQVVHLVGTALLEIQLCSFCLHVRSFVFVNFAFCAAALRCTKNKALPSRPGRFAACAVRAAQFAFIGAK